MYLIIKKTEYSTLTPSYIVERNSKNKELAKELNRIKKRGGDTEEAFKLLMEKQPLSTFLIRD